MSMDDFKDEIREARMTGLRGEIKLSMQKYEHIFQLRIYYSVDILKL